MKNERMKNNFKGTNNRARGNSLRRGKEQTETPKDEKPVRKAPVTFEDIKQQLAAWVENEHIPGKFQAHSKDLPRQARNFHNRSTCPRHGSPRTCDPRF